MARRKTAIEKIQDRAIEVTPGQIAAFPADHIDVELAQACLEGYTTPRRIAEELQLPVKQVRERMLDPVRCGWLSQRIGQLVELRLMSVLGALYARAIRTGEPAAVKLLLDRFGKMLAKPKEHRHLHAHVDLTALSNDQLQRYIDQRMRELGTTTCEKGQQMSTDAEFSIQEPSNAETETDQG